MRANYLTAAQKAIVGMGAPEHHRDAVDFDPKTVGLWRVTVGAQQYPGYIAGGGGHALLPDIMALARGRDATTGWFTTATLKYVVKELGLARRSPRGLHLVGGRAGCGRHGQSTSTRLAWRWRTI